MRRSELKPLVEASVDEVRFQESGTFYYEAIVDVSPPFQAEGYRGLEIERKPIEIGEDQIQTEIENIRQQHAQLRALEAERPVQEGDVAVVDFTPYVHDNVFEKGRTTDHMVEVGKHGIHPQFDEHLVGRQVGDSFSFELVYPEDAPAPEIAGQTVRFDLTVKEIKEKLVPELNDEFAKDAGDFASLEELKKSVIERLRRQEDEKGTRERRQLMTERMLEKIQFNLSPRVVEREVDRLIEMFQKQFESQGLKLDSSHFNTPAIRAEYRPTAEKNLRWKLIVREIARAEGIELSEEELDGIYGEVGKLYRMDAETVREEHAESAIVEQYKENRLQEKVFELMEAEAVYKDPSEEEDQPDQE